jgi:hypothetical protein
VGPDKRRSSNAGSAAPERLPPKIRKWRVRTMRAFTRLTGLVAATALIAGAANAQTCLGYSSLDAAHMNLTGAVGFMASPSQNGTSLDAQLNNRF